MRFGSKGKNGRNWGRGQKEQIEGRTKLEQRKNDETNGYITKKLVSA